MMNKPRVLLGCVVAPLVAPLLMLLIIMVTGEDLRGSSYEYGLNDAIEIFGIAGMFLVLGAPIAYVVTVVVGLPMYFVANRLGLINYWSVTLGSAFVAVFPLLIVWAVDGFIPYDGSEKSTILFYLAFALCGYVVGVVFWFVSGLPKQSAHNRRLQIVAAKPRD